MDFSHQFTKNGKTLISYQGKQIMILSPKKTDDLKKKMVGKNAEEINMILAKLTGNFKRGNERLASETEKNKNA